MTRDISEIPPATWQEAKRRLSVIRQLAALEGRTREDVINAGKALGISATVVYRLLVRYRADRRLTSLLPERRGPREGQRLPVEVEEIVEAAIDDVYLKRQKPKVKDLVDEVRLRCHRQGLRSPGRTAISDRLAKRRPSDVHAKRHGPKAAHDKYGPAAGSLHAPWPLSLIQIDHTLVDVIVVDSVTRQPIQRPWLTLAIDVHSRCVAGYHLTLEHPCATSVALCIAHAALPKDAWLAARGINSEWPVQGRPELIHLDNAKEFRSEALERGCDDNDIPIDHRPVRTPHYGAHIERLIGTIMGKVHLLPGTTFSNIQEKGDYDPSKEAAMTLDEVDRWLAHAIGGLYHHTVHRGIGMTPLAAWDLGINGDDTQLGRGTPTPIEDPRKLLIDFLPLERRTVEREGVFLFKIAYWSDVLRTLVGSGEKLIVRYDPRDLSRIYLRAPDGRYYDLPYADLRRPPITLWEHRAACKRLRELGQSRIDESAIFTTVLAMRAIADHAVDETKRVRRNRERRRLGVASESGRQAPQTKQDDEAAYLAFEQLPEDQRYFKVEQW